MILDVSLAGRLRMRKAALGDLDKWLFEVGLDDDPALLAVEFIGRSEGHGHAVRLSYEGRRRKRVFVSEYPPRSTWWYMTEGETK